MCMDMTCEQFEERLAGYIDRQLESRATAEFAEHALRCSLCHALLDDVKLRLREPGPELDHNSDLEIALETIPVEYARVDCGRFQDLITEFLDGYVPAAVYHRFGEHSAGCGACSRLLTEVVYAVAACHSVHTYEEMEVPADLTERLLAVGQVSEEQLPSDGQMRQRFETGLRRLVAPLAPGCVGIKGGQGPGRLASLLARSVAWPRVATASAIVATTVALLLSGFSADLTVKGIYRRAQVKVASIYSQRNLDIRFEKEQLESRFEQMGSDFNQMLKTLGGSRNAQVTDPDGEQGVQQSSDKTD
jgi:hypothetical protein